MFKNLHVKPEKTSRVRGGKLAWLEATLEECLESLDILLSKSGAQPSVAFSHWL